MNTGQMLFVACNEESCHFNQERSCRSKSISIGQGGICLKKICKEGSKSITETYVEIELCENYACNFWEENPSTKKGRCGLYENLFFNKSFCDSFKKQINEPPNFSATV